ncbi:MAG TPA: carbamoyltransferase C-terminal domain-containing protein [Nevskiales bacterium]|nr:carbamoyltransferase C-terminal domain-containing protein [Nevskiales bacterium]
MSYILGLNAYHGDASACLLADGRLVAAAEEERFRRIKHWAGFPSEAIKYCLHEAGVALRDVEHVAINQDPRAHLLRKVAYTLARRPDLRFIADRLRNKRRRASVAHMLERTVAPGFAGVVHQVEHHLAHLSSAFHVSPFERAVVVSVDGFGDFSSAAWGAGVGSEIRVAGRVFFPHSLGVFYQAMTQWLGFPNYGDEYKVMGLAPYGEPHFMREMRQIVRLAPDGTFTLDLRFFRHDRQRIAYEWEDGEPRVGTLYSEELVRLLGPARGRDEPLTQRDRDIARSVQAMYEEAFFNLLNAAHRQHPAENLCLAGGCAMNSVANGKVYRNTRFRRVYVQSAAGDAGGALGAAFAVWHQLGGQRSFVMDHAYWGPQTSPEEMRQFVRGQRHAIEASGCQVLELTDEGELCRRTAAAIASGQVVGWFQERMEWGPRALGNRSIVCDPRRVDMKHILNRKIKRRESFRPFAPSILREAVPDWFEEDDDVPFMMKVFLIREDKRAQIPAVTHVDGSGRLQTVCRRTNPRFYRLIEAFRDLTGVPMVLNTSFNENEPVVCRPQEALDCFLRTRMDLLVLGDWLVARSDG